MKTLPKGPFLGINNRRPDFALHVPKEGDFVRDAVNVDIDNAARSCDDDLGMQRVDPGKGLVANWHEFFVSEEVYFTLASVSFGPGASTRRI